MSRKYLVPRVRVVYLPVEGMVCASKFGAGEDPYNPESEETNGHEGFNNGGSIWDYASNVGGE